MVFSSPEFIFLFLPVVLLVYYLLLHRSRFEYTLGFLLAASIFFYGWWKPTYVPILISSILVNFTIGTIIMPKLRYWRTTILIIGITFNLGLLGFYKYLNFVVDNINLALTNPITVDTIILPLAISFFTFQQIAFLVDCYQGYTREYSLPKFALFVSFFPQLIAGPIVHHAEMMPQFRGDQIKRRIWVNIGVGLAIFSIGLFKKTVIADTLAVNANTIFNAADQGASFGLVEAWIGALSYTFQLYFDFSGYADMAVGAARMFGIRLPANFNSPYKASSIIDFWRRWHMTLSRFLRDYLYVPLGGNRKGPTRRLINIFITMFLGGIWHGAGWTFILWGALHGIYIVCNHIWRDFFDSKTLSGRNRQIYRIGAFTLTFICVVFAWVFFRATTVSGALSIVWGMVGGNGLPLLVGSEWSKEFTDMWKVDKVSAQVGLILIPVCFVLCLQFPNTQQLMRKYRPVLQPVRPSLLTWRPNATVWTLYTASLLTVGLFYISFYHNRVQEFIYFNF